MLTMDAARTVCPLRKSREGRKQPQKSIGDPNHDKRDSRGLRPGYVRDLRATSHVPPTRRPILGRTAAWNDSRARRRRNSPAIPERSSLAAASWVISCGSVRTPWRHISNQRMNVLHLIGRAALGLSLAHHSLTTFVRAMRSVPPSLDVPLCDKSTVRGNRACCVTSVVARTGGGARSQVELS
jgi:hypothetical protein